MANVFGNPVSLRPGNLPGGTPFAPTSQAQGISFADGNITPQIVVEIAGDPQKRRTDIKNFMLRADVQQLYDPFQFAVPDPEGELLWLPNALIQRMLIPIRIYHKDPFVNNGVERPWLSGVITRCGISSGINGSVATISGYDLGFLLTSCAPIGEEYDLRNLSWPQLARRLIEPSWVQPNVDFGGILGNNAYGFRAITGVNLSRQIRQGRLSPADNAEDRVLSELQQRSRTRQEIEAANNLNIYAPTVKMLTQPGESVADILIRLAKLDQRFINVSPKGDLEFFQPDYITPPQFVGNYNRANGLGDRNAMLDGSREVDTEQLFPQVYCFSSILFPFDTYENDNPLEGSIRGSLNIYDPNVHYYLRRLTFADGDRWNEERAAKRAAWRYQQGVYNADTVMLTAQGHNQNGIAFTSNARIDIRSDKLGVSETRYISAVQYHQEDRGEEGIASYAVLTCKKDKLLAA